MTTYWLKPATMKAVIFVCQLFLIIRTNAQECDPEFNRDPLNSDIEVVCGTRFMILSILYCPILHADYNASLMILNGRTNPECKGEVDLSVTPPMLRFKLSIHQQSLQACGNVFTIINSVGTEEFSQFSNVQQVNVSGIVVSHDPASGLITYRPSITYLYSCEYELQYVLNNTQLAVSGVSIAINDNNGSFISTLGMRLYTDQNYDTLLSIPSTGLNLKDRVYVEVTATNLTKSFNVLLARCFASVEEYQDHSNTYDLFVGCEGDEQTRQEENGISQRGRFSFEAFRFLVHANLTVSTFYIHCITRLCNQSMCGDMIPNCDAIDSELRRRRRDTPEENTATVTSSAISVGQHANTGPSGATPHSAVSARDQYSSPVVAVIVCVAILSLMLVAMGAYFTWNLRQKLRL